MEAHSLARAGLRQYGASKEHRPNPIVQMGMFINRTGFPIAMCINPGNTNEQVTLVPVEKKIVNDKTGFSQRLIVTFSFKYRDYLRILRLRQIERDAKIAANGGIRMLKAAGRSELASFGGLVVICILPAMMAWHHWGYGGSDSPGFGSLHNHVAQ